MRDKVPKLRNVADAIRPWEGGKLDRAELDRKVALERAADLIDARDGGIPEAIRLLKQAGYTKA